MAPDPALVARFAADLDRLIDSAAPVGLAISGGPDSLALLVLANAARPGLVEAATVDHALRAESRGEADMVAGLCDSLRVPHCTLTVDWGESPASGLQERARHARYGLLAGWLSDRRLGAVCTGHHRDDQAETLLMRLARGAGVRGLAGMRPSSPLPGGGELRLLRPLLGWTQADIVAVCESAQLIPVDDPSNEDERFERVRVRKHLAQSGLDGEALARSAEHLRAADEALEWAVDREWSERVTKQDASFAYSPGPAPDEIRRRVVVRLLGLLSTEGPEEPRGRALDGLIATLESGGAATLGGVLARGGSTWHFEPAPRRTSTDG